MNDCHTPNYKMPWKQRLTPTKNEQHNAEQERPGGGAKNRKKNQFASREQNSMRYIIENREKCHQHKVFKSSLDNALDDLTAREEAMCR